MASELNTIIAERSLGRVLLSREECLNELLKCYEDKNWPESQRLKSLQSYMVAQGFDRPPLDPATGGKLIDVNSAEERIKKIPPHLLREWREQVREETPEVRQVYELLDDVHRGDKDDVSEEDLIKDITPHDDLPLPAVTDTT